MALDLIGESLGGEGGIRTPGTLASTSDFESGAFNRALPPLRVRFERPAIQTCHPKNGDGGGPGNLAPELRCGWRNVGPLRG